MLTEIESLSPELTLSETEKRIFIPWIFKIYPGQNFLNMDYLQSAKGSLITAVACCVRLTTGYRYTVSYDADENPYDDIAHKAVELLIPRFYPGSEHSLILLSPKRVYLVCCCVAQYLSFRLTLTAKARAGNQ